MQRKYVYRRKLPHFQRDFKAYFITFCTKNRWVLPPSARDIVLEVCEFGHNKFFHLHTVVVMPDHVHLLLDPLVDSEGPISIPEIMQTLKSTSAHRINKSLERRGPVWQQESFDRILRAQESLLEATVYLLGNPVRAGLVRDPNEYKWTWNNPGELLSSDYLRARTPAAPLPHP